MKTDSLFYEIFQADPSIIFELINSKFPRNATYSFTSVEVKETSFRMDGILIPPIYATDLPIVFVEVQGYRDTKKVLYSSFISEIFLYLYDYQPVNDWEGVLIFTKRSLDPGLPRNYRVFGSSEQFHRIYLDELNENTDISLGLSLLQLVGLREELATTRGRELITRTRQEVTDAKTQSKFIELIETVFVYKFPDSMREEIEAMLGLNELKQTRVYREALEEGLEQGLEQGKLKAVPLLLKAGITVEEIAKQLGVDLAAVRKVAEEQSA
ncbi:Rpn family recombination-promoting nuclease/putative transposase [Anabaena lutea]|uniref:Rpn family recombination-promoting nuclease/putative transposase n=1 Tax=Anabaena lutea FACHB-196 TaxID=2692881 RepID=A0ABR8FPL9_9NOST|nr:Rpn family recombination-promoting nuclease/putative transposase [Anabaena lutea]MBD2570894.1 Rpn family recombination-promoting nuclease/putative transposase [Anabaena lutea FACHB-196]